MLDMNAFLLAILVALAVCGVTYFMEKGGKDEKDKESGS